MSDTQSKPMPLFSVQKDKPMFGTSNFVPIIGLALAMLGTFYTFATAQTKQETGLATVQSEVKRVEIALGKELLRVETTQVELKRDIKEELEKVTRNNAETQQLLFKIQLQLVELKQGQKK